jgi:ATP/maltotriose-dependent transcriptional regulator MalT
LGQGDAGGALASLRRALEESPEWRYRPMLLAACVEAAIAAGELAVARRAAEEVVGIAAAEEVPYLRALAGRATGAVRLAEGDARGARVELRDAERIWLELEAPYEAARTRVLVGRASGEAGDVVEAEMSLAGAAAVFEQVGARTDLRRYWLERRGIHNPPELEVKIGGSGMG